MCPKLAQFLFPVQNFGGLKLGVEKIPKCPKLAAQFVNFFCFLRISAGGGGGGGLA